MRARALLLLLALPVPATATLSFGCQPGPRNGDPGAACTDDGDCDAGLVCETGFPGGYCTASCAGGASCPDGTGCVNLSGLELCLRDCGDLLLSGVQTPVEALLERVAIYPSSAYGGTLDVNVHLTPASGVTAATAMGSLFLTQMLNRFWEIMLPADVGFEVGEVAFFDAPAAYNTIGNNLDDGCAELSVPAASGGPAVNVLVVGDFVNGALGRSSGVPGTMMDAGTTLSCVAVARLSDNGAYIGDTVAHEVGHFLGLHHTSELGGASCGSDFCWDAISDTGECTDPMVSPALCPDYTNIMFPTNYDQRGGFSPGQALVLSGAPVVY